MPKAPSLLSKCFTRQPVHIPDGVQQQQQHTFMAWLGTSVRFAIGVAGAHV